MRCVYHSRKCMDCDEHLADCNQCESADNEGEGFKYCTNDESRFTGDCVEDLAPCCNLFKQREVQE